MTFDEGARAANRARFARLIVAGRDDDVDLARAALAIAADGRPDLDPTSTLSTLDDLAERVRLRLDLGDEPTVVIDRLHQVLYREFGYRSATLAAASDPRNSQLDRVVARRVGLPISLAVVELEVGWRIGLRLFGIGLPGHFIVGGPDGVLIDPAGAGRRLTRDDCQALIREALGEQVLFHAGMLRPTGRRAILARILRNLRGAHLAARRWADALGAVELLEIVDPAEPDHGRDRGLLLGRMGRFTEAISLLDRYLGERPGGHDAADVRQVIGIFAGRRN